MRMELFGDQFTPIGVELKREDISGLLGKKFVVRSVSMAQRPSAN